MKIIHESGSSTVPNFIEISPIGWISIGDTHTHTQRERERERETLSFLY